MALKKILKFGGTSVGSPDRTKQVIDLILASQKEHGHIAVVVSAFSKVTDQLIEMGHLSAKGDESYRIFLQEFEKRHLDAVRALMPLREQSAVLAHVKVMMNELGDTLHGIFLIKELSLRTLDFLMSFGERLSAFIIAETLHAGKHEAEWLDARLVVKTDDAFGNAHVKFELTNENIRKYFQEHPSLQIITGFIGSTEQGETTTLGRGGSDYTASVFGVALGVSEIEIWTDVDGVMTADPRKVKKAFSLPRMTYAEAMELSHFGAKVIHPPTMQPARDASIPLRIKNTFHPEFPGTLISDTAGASSYLISGIASLPQVALLRIEGSGLVGVAGMAKRLFGSLSDAGVNVILISQASSEHSICFAISPKDVLRAKKAAEREFSLEMEARRIDELSVEKDCSIVAVVGENMRHQSGISARLFGALGKNGINVMAIAQGSSELNISVVIPAHDETKALNAIHEAFFLSGTKSLNVFLVGAGLIGGTLLRQMEKQAPLLLKNSAIDIRMIALANSKKMIFMEDGIPLEEWEKFLEDSKEKMNFPEFIRRMKALNLSHSILVDCTASDEVVSSYEEILHANISLVTPNKRANAGSLKQYHAIRRAAEKSGATFLYETNVGAGLPVINTLQDLLKSGDRLLRIEGVLSGTLSYLFNTFSTTEGKFSDLVRAAKEKGYTEPDPRDDLNGMDVARKLLILGREAGYPLELSDISVESLVPEYGRDARSVEEFFALLPKADQMFEEKKVKARSEGKVLRYIASLGDGKGMVSLQAVDAKHPFYALSGSDNMISFTTERYRERPLVIKGPGAGGEVTAAGVFADIIRLAHYYA